MRGAVAFHRARDRVIKRRLYAQAGIPHYWLIDPELRVLEALALRDGVWVELGVYDETATARRACPFFRIAMLVPIRPLARPWAGAIR
jgi:Uma2 family endonuclease